MKTGVRVLAVACAPAEKRETFIIGVISRNGYIEGILSSKISVDGEDSTNVLIEMISKSRFKDQIRILMLNGLSIAGLNILDLSKFEKTTGVTVLSITRRKPHPDQLIKALKAFSKAERENVGKRIKLVERIKEINYFKIKKVYVQTKMEKGDASKFVDNAFALIRLAHLIASGVSKGESKGRI